MTDNQGVVWCHSFLACRPLRGRGTGARWLGALSCSLAIFGLVAVCVAPLSAVPQFSEGQRLTSSQLNAMLRDLNGAGATLSTYTADRTVLLFWSPLAAVSRHTLSTLTRVEERYRSDRRVSVVGIAVGVPAKPSEGANGQQRAVARMVEASRINFPVLVDDEGEVARLFQLVGIPTILIVRKDGTVLKAYGSPPGAEDIIRDLEFIASGSP